MKAKQRLDLALVERNLVESQEKARALILAGKVFVNSQKMDKPGHAIALDASVYVEQRLKYVSRGGLKLEAALQAFDIRAAGKICMDVGTSTGGFTDCLLQAGAIRVHAVDTGAGQIDWRLRSDGRVVLHEKTNARFLNFENIGEQIDIIACDVSFISVTRLIPALEPLLRGDGDWVILIKPQFEVPRERVGEGGIVRDPLAHQFAIDRVSRALRAAGFITGLLASPILGVEGNQEFLLHGQRQLSS